jgi:hypothetical protein
MAVKWAIANGNWNTPEIWNDGELPQGGDTIYCNGYNITYTTDVNIGNGLITNALNPNTNRVGGRMVESNSNANVVLSLIANLEAVNTEILTVASSGTGATIIRSNIVGNITTTDCYAIYKYNYYENLTITGNVNGRLITEQNYNNNTITINGNVTQEENNYLIYGNSTTYNIATVNINGIYKTNYQMSNQMGRIVAINIIGELQVYGGIIINKAIKLDGVLNCVGNNDLIPTTSLTTSTRIIVKTMPTADYPPEDAVKQGVEYAWGELIGTYLPDYPPETVVLKDYAYDGGEMVGTYEGGGTVQNTINVYPYKRRNH